MKQPKIRIGKESKLELWMKASVAVRRALYINNPKEEDIRIANMLVQRYQRLYNEPFTLNGIPPKE